MPRPAILIVLCLLLLGWRSFFLYPPTNVGTPVTAADEFAGEVLLVPLDSRPPCKDFAVKIGKVATLKVTPPPTEMLDYYSTPGETEKIYSWLRENIGGKRAVIISVDQLLFGGLLAARESVSSKEQIDELIFFLRELHRQNPAVPIYAFSILPRLHPQDSIDGYEERRALIEYSRLMGKKGEGLIVDENKINELKQKISSSNMAKYRAHFTANRELNEALAALAEEKTLELLVVGQDDGEPYSIGNLEKEKFRLFLARKKIGENRVFIMHGADEIALMILAKIVGVDSLSCYVGYNADSTPDMVMPYMAVTLAEVAAEKLRFLGISETAEPCGADFSLIISANDYAADTLGTRRGLIKKMGAYRQSGLPIALVDLSRHFSRCETVLPLMIRENYPINSLIAYAGWNTASNSIGTVIAQGAVYTVKQKNSVSIDEAQQTVRANLSFLQERFIEDNFYLKYVIDLVNARLRKSGYANTADLDLQHNYLWANHMMRGELKKLADIYKYSKSFRQPITFATPSGAFSLQATNLAFDAGYPWPRTFEISVAAYPYLTVNPP